MYKTQVNVILNAIKEPIKEKLGVQYCPFIEDQDKDLIHDVLGFGGNGFVVKTNTKNLVLKVTKDVFEITAIQKIKDKNLKGYVNTLDPIFRIGSYDSDFYIYWREEVTPLSVAYTYDSKLPIINFQAISYILEELKNSNIEFELATVKNKKLMGYLLEEIVDYDPKFKDVAKVISYTTKKSIYLSDIKFKNMGLSLSHDNYVIFDSSLSPHDYDLQSVFTLPYLNDKMINPDFYIPYAEDFYDMYFSLMKTRFNGKYNEFAKYMNDETFDVLMGKTHDEMRGIL